MDSALCTLDTHSTSLLEEVSSLSIIFLRADLRKYVQITLIISSTCTIINVDYHVYCPFKVEIPLTSVNFSVISVFHLQHNILWSQSPII